MVTEEQLHDEIVELDAKVGELIDNFDKSKRKWHNRLYYFAVRILSLVALVLCFYTAYMGMAGASAVMAFLFLATWGMYLLGYFGVEVAKGMWKNINDKTQNKYKTRLRR